MRGNTKGRGRGVLGGGGVWWMVRDCLGGNRTPQETPLVTHRKMEIITFVLTTFKNQIAGRIFIQKKKCWIN
jgi:hypothetical protein